MQRWIAAAMGACFLVLLTACSPGNVVSVQYQGYHPTLDRSSIKTGEITFNLDNHNGQVTHEFIVAQTDLPADHLPLNGTQVDETGLKIVARSAKLDVGQTGTLAASLPPGHYVLFCNIIGHYQLGMHTDFTVSP